MEFLLPDIGEGVAEGEIVKWHVGPGDKVTEEQDFVEVMTDKASVMIPCPVTGVVQDLLAKEGDVIEVHKPIATFSEVTGGRLAGGHGGESSAPAKQEAQPQRGEGRKQAAAGGGGNGAGGNGSGTALLDAPRERVLATPATRRHARVLGLDIKRVPGTGPAGRVTREDVERAASGGPAPASAPQAPSAAPARPAPQPAAQQQPAAQPAPTFRPRELGPAGEEEERVPLRGVRRKIAEYLSHSKRTAAHYTYVEEVDVTKLVALRQRMKPAAEARGVKLTYLAFITKAVTLALHEHPHINVAMDDAAQEIVYKRYFNIGIAADTPNGLVVPVVKHADRRSILELAHEIRRLGEGARAGSLSPAELQGGTFTITSAGHIGGLLATPILNYPEAAILGVHKIKKRPVVNEQDEIVIGQVMYLSLSLDHRVIDGADAARFMNAVVKYLEEPDLFILEGVQVVGASQQQEQAAAGADLSRALGLARVLDEEGQVIEGAAVPELSDERLLELYRTMRLMRAIDLRLEGLQRMGRIGFFGSARGQEASVIGSGAGLRPTDWVFPALRENAIMLLRGFPLAKYFAHMFGNSLDPLKGRMQPMHFAGREVNFVSWSSCIANQLPQAVGAAHAIKLRGEDGVAAGFVGDGGTSEPDFHAALNFAAVWKSPAVFIIQNNQWAISVPVAQQSASETLAVKAHAYGMPGVRVDGNDVLAVYREVKAAADRARRGEGPTLLELVTFRIGGHSSADDPTRYRDRQAVEAWEGRCPLARLRAYLLASGRWDEDRDEALEQELRAEISAAVKEAEAAAPPPPASLLEDVYAEDPPSLREQRAVLEAELREQG